MVSETLFPRWINRNRLLKAASGLHTCRHTHAHSDIRIHQPHLKRSADCPSWPPSRVSATPLTPYSCECGERSDLILRWCVEVSLLQETGPGRQEVVRLGIFKCRRNYYLKAITCKQRNSRTNIKSVYILIVQTWHRTVPDRPVFSLFFPSYSFISCTVLYIAITVHIRYASRTYTLRKT